jgi:hypothetical protein
MEPARNSRGQPARRPVIVPGTLLSSSLHFLDEPEKAVVQEDEKDVFISLSNSCLLRR